LQEGSSNAVGVMAEGSKQAQAGVEQVAKTSEMLQVVHGAIHAIDTVNSQILKSLTQQSQDAEELNRQLDDLAKCWIQSQDLNQKNQTEQWEKALSALEKQLVR
jgi:aerotaxis receptor